MLLDLYGQNEQMRRSFESYSGPEACLMNINEVTRRSTSKIRQRHHRASKPGSVQAEQSRTEWTELLQLFGPFGIFYGVFFKKETNSVDCIKNQGDFLIWKSESKDTEKGEIISMVTKQLHCYSSRHICYDACIMQCVLFAKTFNVIQYLIHNSTLLCIASYCPLFLN